MPTPSEAPPAIEVRGATVTYAIPREAIGSLKEYAIRKVRGRIERDQFVALRDVSLTVRPAESVGIVGPNGAGKSTLFRLIARVRRPASGRVIVRGRVSALLDLGLGTHGELTGRENVFLLGALAGLPRSEVARRMESIASFAELEGFLDAPLRTYSAGMAARLAFAAATDVEPDILLVDEALAVGDERFRSRCVERMEGFRRNGRAFLVASHSLSEVESTCQRAIWMMEGRVEADGPAPEVCGAYRRWAASAPAEG